LFAWIDSLYRHCEAIGRSRPSLTGYGDEAIQNCEHGPGLRRVARNDDGDCLNLTRNYRALRI
jgi:hypothetical protein